MKNIIKSLVVIAAVGAIAAGATYSVYTASATVQNNTFSTGTPGLEVSLTGNGFGSLANGFRWEGLYPGWTQNQDIYLYNSSSSDIAFSVVPQVNHVYYSTGLANYINLYFTFSDGTYETKTYSLATWESNTSVNLNYNLPQHQTGHWIAHFSIPPNATDAIQGQTIQFNLQFNGTQVQ